MKKYTYGQWLQVWYKTYKEPFITNYRTLYRYIELYIPDSIKKLSLNDNFDILAVQRAINAIKLSRTRVEIFDLYHGSLYKAYTLGIISKDLSLALIKPKHKRVLGEALTVKEVELFLQRIKGHRYEYYYLFLLFTGSRRSEALNVTLSDFNFINSEIHIKGTKTELSDRYVPLFPALNDYILDYLEKIYKGDPHKKLFPFSKRRVTEVFKEFMPLHKLHDLRHTFATRCLESGINIKVVQRWLGHSRLDTTASIYTHLEPEFVKSETKKFNLGV